MEKKTFLFPSKWFAPLRALPGDVRDEVFLAVMEYWETGKVPKELKQIAGVAFAFLKGDIDSITQASEELSEKRKNARKQNVTNVDKREQNVTKDNKQLQNVTNVDKREQNGYNIREDNIREDNIREDKCECESKNAPEGAHTHPQGSEDYLSLLVDYMNEHASGTSHQPKNGKYWDFLAYIRSQTPYIASHMKPLTVDEFERLLTRYSIDDLIDTVTRIENRRDLRKKYSNLYRTLISWLKNRHDD